MKQYRYTNKDVLEVKEAYEKEGLSYKQLAEVYGVDVSVIRSLVTTAAERGMRFSAKKRRNAIRARQRKALAKALSETDLLKAYIEGISKAEAEARYGQPGKLLFLLASPALKRLRRLWSRGHGKKPRQFTDEDMLAWVRKAAEVCGEPLSYARYSAWARATEPAPSGIAVLRRFGGWVRTAELAGIVCGPSARQYSSRYTDEELQEALLLCIKQGKPLSSIGAPYATLRARFGPASTLLKRLVNDGKALRLEEVLREDGGPVRKSSGGGTSANRRRSTRS